MNSNVSYIRDGRAPIPKKESTSRVMSANKGRNTGPEVKLRQILCKNGIRGYRLNWKKAPGRPDIAFPKRKKAIFVHGCYWHRCSKCRLTLPKSNADFWREKFAKNIKRDKLKQKELRKDGWDVLIVWECEIKKDIKKAKSKVIKFINSSYNESQR